MKHRKCKRCNDTFEIRNKRGAGYVYCVPCDRLTARKRMRNLRLKDINKKVDNLYYRLKPGEVYVISNDAWYGWYKVGCAIDSNDRLRHYQTGSPFRNYILEYSISAKNKLRAERKVHDALDKLPGIRQGEWFFIKLQDIIKTIKELNIQ